MSYYVEMKRVSDGEVKVIRQDLPWTEGSDFWWCCGNFGCDCNRSAEFRGDDGDECGDGVRFKVLVVRTGSGEVLWGGDDTGCRVCEGGRCG